MNEIDRTSMEHKYYYRERNGGDEKRKECDRKMLKNLNATERCLGEVFHSEVLHLGQRQNLDHVILSLPPGTWQYQLFNHV